MTPRIYLDEMPLHNNILLTKEQTHHLATVLKLRAGASVTVCSNNVEYDTKINQLKPVISLDIMNKTAISRESNLNCHLVQGISRGDRMDYAIQKAVELGVKTITPVITEKMSFKLDANRLQKRHQHWQNIILSAAEQSGRTQLPQLNTALPLKDFCQQQLPHVIYFDTTSKQPLAELKINNGEELCILIGSESGWSDKETVMFQNAGFSNYSLGPRILRTETAPIVALSILQHIFGDL